jgi:hypothetical protein
MSARSGGTSGFSGDYINGGAVCLPHTRQGGTGGEIRGGDAHAPPGIDRPIAERAPLLSWSVGQHGRPTRPTRAAFQHRSPAGIPLHSPAFQSGYTIIRLCMVEKGCTKHA